MKLLKTLKWHAKAVSEPAAKYSIPVPDHKMSIVKDNGKNQVFPTLFATIVNTSECSVSVGNTIMTAYGMQHSSLSLRQRCTLTCTAIQISLYLCLYVWVLRETKENR